MAAIATNDAFEKHNLSPPAETDAIAVEEDGATNKEAMTIAPPLGSPAFRTL